MINSVPNGDWSNSVPGRKIPEGPIGIYSIIILELRVLIIGYFSLRSKDTLFTNLYLPCHCSVTSNFTKKNEKCLIICIIKIKAFGMGLGAYMAGIGSDII